MLAQTGVHRWCLVLLFAASAAGCGSGSGGSAGERPPTIAELTAETQAPSPGAETTLEVRTSGDAAKEELSYHWQVREGGWSIDGSGRRATITAPDRYGSRARVVVEVTDGASTASAGRVLSTGSNASPRVVGVDVSPRPIPAGETATVTARASDPRGDALAYRWTAPEGWSLGSNTGPSVDVTAPDRSGEQARLDLRVDDGHGGSLQRTVTVRTEVNRPPTVTSVSASPPQLTPGGRTDVTVEASDPNGDDLDYQWSAPNAWTVEGSGRRVEIRAPNERGASAEIDVEVTDGHGGSDTGGVVIGVERNVGPRIHDLSASPQTVDRAGTIDLKIDASDPNGDSLGYRWTTSAPGWDLTRNGASARAGAPDRPSSTARIEVTVTDVDGASARASQVVATRPNRAPSVARIVLSPGVLEPSATGTARVVASDPEGDSLSFSWNAPADWSIGGQGEKVQLTAPNDYGRRGLLRVRADDGHGGTTSAATTVATERNEPPSIASVDAKPSVIDADGTTTLSVSASDPNGDSLSYNWSRPKGWSQVGAAGATLKVEGPGSYATSGRFAVTVSDGHGGTAKGAVVVQTRRNKPPQIASIKAPKTTIDPGRSVVLEVVASDPEGGNLSYGWTVPKPWTHKPLSGGRRVRITAPKKVSNSATLVVEVTDPQGASSREAIQVKTPDNRAPVIQAIGVNPGTAEPGEKVTFTSQVTDPEGDPIQYTWRLPKGWGGASSSAKLVATAGRQYGKKVPIELRAADLYSVSSKTVKVQIVPNKPPSIKSLKVKPNPVQRGQSTTADVSASDPYGDSLSYTWSINSQSWSINGSGKSVKVKAPNSSTTAQLTVTVDDGHGKKVSTSQKVESISLNGSGTGSNPYRAQPLRENCKEYENNFPSSATKDGIYRVQVNGNTFKVYCDMSRNGGGWTLVLQGNDRQPHNYSWCRTSGYSVPTNPGKNNREFKYSDSRINALRGTKGIYRLTGDGSQHEFLKAFTYRHDRDTDHFAKSRRWWSNPSFTGSRQQAYVGNGSGRGIATSHGQSYQTNHEHGDCYVTTNGRHARLWVR